MQGLRNIGLGNKLIDEAKTTHCKSKNRQARFIKLKSFAQQRKCTELEKIFADHTQESG